MKSLPMIEMVASIRDIAFQGCKQSQVEMRFVIVGFQADHFGVFLANQFKQPVRFQHVAFLPCLLQKCSAPVAECFVVAGLEANRLGIFLTGLFKQSVALQRVALQLGLC